MVKNYLQYGDLGLIPGSGRYLGQGMAVYTHPLQVTFSLEGISTDRGAGWATVMESKSDMIEGLTFFTTTTYRALVSCQALCWVFYEHQH